MRLRMLLIAAVLAAGAGCSSTLDWSKVPNILPRESPRMAVARFQLALLDWNSADSFESLTQTSQGVIGYFKWKVIMPHVNHPELPIKIFALMLESKVDECFEVGPDPNSPRRKAEAIMRHEELGEASTAYLYLEEGEWKVGLVETFMPGKAKEYEEEQRKKPEP